MNTKKYPIKKIIIILLALLISAGGYFFYTMVLNPKSPKATTSIDDDGLSIEIDYARPYKRGRTIFGTANENALLVHGKYWRLGANAPTVLKVNQNIKFAGKNLNAGQYAMYAFPNDEFWEIRLNTKINKSGHEQPDSNFDVLVTSIPLITVQKYIEQLTISLKIQDYVVEMHIEWDDKKLIIPLEEL